jgi:predicted Zn-dependent peptidase
MGRFTVDLETTQGLASQILKSEELKLGFDYINRFPELVNHLTLNDVNRAIRRYFHPNQLTVVAAGDITDAKQLQFLDRAS